MKRALARLAVLAGIAAFLGLGVWQLERLREKRALISDVTAKLSAAAVAAPSAAKAATSADAYRRVALTGRYVGGADTQVQAVTALGGGFWVISAFDAPQGRILVNRGFVPAAARLDHPPPPPGVVRVTGLLRLSEPRGGFLRSNDPAAGRWYSRDTQAIATARGLGAVADWFVDADATGPEWPRGGMTVVAFRNTHLIYALTWFAMAGLLAWLAWRATRRGAA